MRRANQPTNLSLPPLDIALTGKLCCSLSRLACVTGGRRGGKHTGDGRKVATRTQPLCLHAKPFPSPTHTTHSRAAALVLLGMLAVATAQGPPVEAVQEKIDAAADGSVLAPDGSVLLPPTNTEGALKFVHSMVTSQADMIAEMVDKV